MHRKHLTEANKSELKVLSKLLVLIGALNWGIVGLLNFDLVAVLFGKNSLISKLVYIFVGLAGAYLLITHKEKYLALKKKWHSKGEKKYSGKQYSWSGIQ